jgi:hypothetical protein
MSNDDKYGIGAGLMALGLAAGVILLGQATYSKEIETATSASSAPADSAHNSGGAKDTQPSLFYRIIPHRQPNAAEEIFDGIVCALALLSGIFFFISAMLGGAPDQESEKKDG